MNYFKIKSDWTHLAKSLFMHIPLSNDLCLAFMLFLVFCSITFDQKGIKPDRKRSGFSKSEIKKDQKSQFTR